MFLVGLFLESSILHPIKDSILMCPVDSIISALLTLHSGKNLIIFSWTVSVFLEFSDIFFPIKYTGSPKRGFCLRRDCKRDLKNFRHVRMEMAVFFKTSANTTPRKTLLLEGLNRFSLN